MIAFNENPDIVKALESRPKWVTSFLADPRISLLQSDEPFTVLRTLVDLLDFSPSHPLVKQAKEMVLADEKVQGLIHGLPPDWESYLVKGHQKADYPPSVLLLLFDFGVEKSDSPQIERLLAQMLGLQDEDGRFQSLAMFPRSNPVIGSSLCDTHIITEALMLGGFGNDKAVQRAINFIAGQLKETTQGIAWKCEPNSVSKARGPGRKDDICPQVTLEALRTFSHLTKKDRPVGLVDAGRTLLMCYEHSEHRPYLFGHGTRFKKLKPPFFWYDIGSVLDAASRYPELTKEPSFNNMLSLVIAKANPDGKFTPDSVYLDFKDWSFGQKKEWSPWLTLYICRILKRAYG